MTLLSMRYCQVNDFTRLGVNPQNFCLASTYVFEAKFCYLYFLLCKKFQGNCWSSSE